MLGHFGRRQPGKERFRGPGRFVGPQAQDHRKQDDRQGDQGELTAERQGQLVVVHRAGLLGDLGLSREEALREAAKPFWR